MSAARRLVPLHAERDPRAMGTVRIGISGWRYAGWRGVFYPPGLPQRRELEYASRRFGSIELNGSFYSLQRPESWAGWRSATPPGFVFAVKGSRYATHFLKLRSRPSCRTTPSGSSASSPSCRATPPPRSRSQVGATPA